jgi:hypothetical protein
VSLAVTLSHLLDDDANLLFCTGHCFVCHTATRRTEKCSVRGHHVLFCKRLDDPHRE